MTTNLSTATALCATRANAWKTTPPTKRLYARVPVDKMPSIPINALWLPPFVLAAVLKDGIAQYERRQGISSSWHPDAPLDKRWTLGCVLFHLKDSKYTGGSSLLLSPFELDIPLYGL